MSDDRAPEMLLDAEAMKKAAFAVFAKANENNLGRDKIEALWPSQFYAHWDGLAEAAVRTYLSFAPPSAAPAAQQAFGRKCVGGECDWHRACIVTEGVLRECQERCRKLQAELDARTHPAPSGQAVAVKPLEWEQPDGPEGTAWLGHCTDMCQYYIRFDTATASYWLPGDLPLSDDDDSAQEFLALDEAKAAAQADYERRILSALVPAPAVPGAVERKAGLFAERVVAACRAYMNTYDVLADEVREHMQVSMADALRASDALAANHMPVGDGVAAIAAERRRQINAEGWTPEHDATHTNGEMAIAAACYALNAADDSDGPEIRFAGADLWPWDDAWWKPSGDPVRDLEKAGALIAAEIDRLKRLVASTGEAGRV